MELYLIQERNNKAYQASHALSDFGEEGVSSSPKRKHFNTVPQKHNALKALHSKAANKAVFTQSETVDSSTLWCCECTAEGGAPSVVVLVDTAAVHVLFRVPRLWMTQPVIVLYQCQHMDACTVGELVFFLKISMGSVFLSTEVCFLHEASQCWLWRKHTVYKWLNIRLTLKKKSGVGLSHNSRTAVMLTQRG